MCQFNRFCMSFLVYIGSKILTVGLQGHCTGNFSSYHKHPDIRAVLWRKKLLDKISPMEILTYISTRGSVDGVTRENTLTEDGLDPKEVPIKALIIPKERAVREMLDAIERERPQYMFPRRIRYLIALGQRMPERVRNWLLGRAV